MPVSGDCQSIVHDRAYAHAGLFWLPVHRFMLLTEILVTTIILHVSNMMLKT